MNINAPGFCHWLAGVLDASLPGDFDAERVHLVRERLNDVFLHDIDPSFPKGQQKALEAAHEGLAYNPLHGSYDLKGPTPRC